MQILLSLTLSGCAVALVLLTLRYVLLKRMPLCAARAGTCTGGTGGARDEPTDHRLPFSSTGRSNGAARDAVPAGRLCPCHGCHKHLGRNCSGKQTHAGSDSSCEIKLCKPEIPDTLALCMGCGYDTQLRALSGKLHVLYRPGAAQSQPRDAGRQACLPHAAGKKAAALPLCRIQNTFDVWGHPSAHHTAGAGL